VKNKRPADPGDAEFLKATRLIEKREYKRAEQALRLGLKKTQQEEDPNGTGFYYQALGFLYLLQQKKAEALSFYQKADAVSRDYHAKLAYARLLTTIYGDHATALSKTKEALDLLPKRDRAAKQAYNIMGLCFLGLGDRESAIIALANSLKLDPPSSDSYDLTLISELIRQGVYDKRCVRYLLAILKKAKTEGNERVIRAVNELLAESKRLEQTTATGEEC